MSKIWKDIDIVFEEEGECKSNFKKLMEEKPNFDKRVDNNMIYSKKEYIVKKVCNDFLIININKDFRHGHTHVKSFKMAKTIIDNCIRKRVPKTSNLYLLDSHVRLSNDVKYKTFIKDIIKSKNRK